MDQKTKEKIKKTLKDKFERGELVANMSGAHSKESREKQRKSKIGKSLSDRHKNSISQGVNSSPAYQEAIKNPERIKKIKDTKREKYGDENYVNSQQIIKTNLEKYDKENFISTSRGLEARKNTWIKKYGVDNPQKDPDIFYKTQSASFKKHPFKELIYQGTFEQDFLETFYDIIKIEKAPSIKYKYNRKERIYFPDFYLPGLNLIIEIKSQYYYNKFLEINLEKEQACISQGYNFLFIIDRDYEDFLKILKEFNKDALPPNIQK